MRARLVDTDCLDWRQYLSRLRHDVCHRPEHVSFTASDRDVGRGRAVLVDDGEAVLIAPLVVRATPDGRFIDAASPRPHAGPILSPAADEDFCRLALDAALGLLTHEGVVSLYLRPHPLLPLPINALLKRGQVVYHQETVSIDLTRPEDERWQMLRKNHRRDIARALRAGYLVEQDVDWEHLVLFTDLYRKTMRRVAAEEHWMHDATYFRALRQAMGDDLQLWVVRRGAEVVGGGLFSRSCGLVDYLSSGTATEHLPASPLKVLLWEVGRQQEQAGAEILHLGGSPRRGDSLSAFKTGFSPLTHPVSSWRVVLRPDDYERMVEQRRAEIGGSLDPGFFPAYRAPAATQ